MAKQTKDERNINKKKNEEKYFIEQVKCEIKRQISFILYSSHFNQPLLCSISLEVHSSK